MNIARTKQLPTTQDVATSREAGERVSRPSPGSGGAMAASICPRCDYHTGTPIFAKDVDGFTLTYVGCDWCGYVS